MSLFVIFLRPYLQCWRCEKPFGCLQSMLRLYLSDHLCGRFWVLRVLDLFGIYIYKRKKLVGCVTQGASPPVSPLQGTLSPVTPLAYGTKVCVRAYGMYMYVCFTYARRQMRDSFSISVARSIVPVCRDGIMSLNCFLMGPNTGSLILT